ncbi:MAG: 3-dehydroquinate synthase [Chthoniobacteraceae bacterium]
MSDQTRTIAQRITVAWEFPVTFTHGLLRPANRVLADTLCRLDEHRRHKAMVFIDGHVATARTGIVDEVNAYFAAHGDRLELAGEPRIVPGGESIKNNILLVEGFMQGMLERHMDRQSFIIIIGGGAVMDAVGLAAALVHRGLRQVRVPTTVLGQNDAGVGVKNGINFMGGKNAIGTFAPPFAVLNDLDFLVTLPQRDWLCGVAEAWKVAIIRDREFFEWLTANAAKFPARDVSAMEQLVFRCAEEHLEHIRSNGDPFEYGRARPLDFGHWSAHKLELMSGFRISHGEAVAFGVLLDSSYAREKGWISVSEYAAIEGGLRASGFPLWHGEALERDSAGRLEIFAGLRDFREHLGGELCVTFPQGLGARFEVHEIDLPLMERCLNGLRHG